MPKPFLNSLITISTNLVVMVLVYSLLANALVRLHWHRRGAISVTAMIFVAGLSWIVASFVLALVGLGDASGAFWFGNWLVSGCSVVILCQRAGRIPRELEDLARMDGSGWFGTYQRIVLPLVRRELVLLALLTAMATSVLFWAVFTAPYHIFPPGEFPPWPSLWLAIMGEPSSTVIRTWLEMITGSLIMSLPVILIFILAKRYLEEPAIRLGEAKSRNPLSE